MIRRPPTSTLFPTRRSSDLRQHSDKPQFTTRSPAGLIYRMSSPEQIRTRFLVVGSGIAGLHTAWRASQHGDVLRSEEHTSELQSRRDLVCRLLLEKKKNRI